MYNVRLGYVCATIFVVEMQEVFWVCVCSLSYPAYSAHAPYYHLICCLAGRTIFFHIIS